MSASQPILSNYANLFPEKATSKARAVAAVAAAAAAAAVAAAAAAKVKARNQEMSFEVNKLLMQLNRFLEPPSSSFISALDRRRLLELST